MFVRDVCRVCGACKEPPATEASHEETELICSRNAYILLMHLSFGVYLLVLPQETMHGMICCKTGDFVLILFYLLQLRRKDS